MLLEVCNLPYIEDVYGRPSAGEVLRNVSRLVTENTRGIDFAARYHDNQIMICLVRADREGLEAVSHRILEATRRLPVTCPLGGARGRREEGESEARELEIVLVAGGAIAPAHGREASLLVSKAEKALLAAKRLGPGHLFTAES
jgi:GGDEF domain-containing protein